MSKTICACRRKDCSAGIRIEHLGPHHWRIHDRHECVNVIHYKRTTIARLGSTDVLANERNRTGKPLPVYSAPPAGRPHGK